MKRRPLFRFLPSRLFLLIAPLIAAWPHQQVHAQTNGTWTNLAGGSWPTVGNWSASTVAAGVGAIADFGTLNITANATVTLDGARTVGTLRFQDATTASNDWILNTGTAGPLTLDVASGTASIAVLNRTATIGAVLAGNDGLTVSSAATGTVGGTLVLGAANTLSGGITLTGGILQLNNNTAAGANTITIQPATNTGIANRLVVNGGVTITNPIVINGGAPAVGNGLVQSAGTGRASVNGPITINGNATNGGHLVSSGSELFLGGPITSSVVVAQRAGRVIYAGGGTGYTSLVASGTVVAGATNGISSLATVQLGGSENCTLDLNGFDQMLAGINFGNAGANSALTGTVSLGARTLTVDGGFGGTINTLNTGTGNAPHAINATAGGTLSFGPLPGFLNVADSAAPDDLTITTATVNAPGGLTKTGFGTLSLNGAQVQGQLIVNSGTLAVGRFNAGGSATATSLTLDPGTAVSFKAGPAAVDTITAGTLVANGTNVNILQNAGILAPGTYPLMNYGGASPGLGGFLLQPFGHADATLVDTGSAIALRVNANEGLRWTGAFDGNLDEFSNNWNLAVSGTPAAFRQGDEVTFPDGPVNTVVSVGATVNAARINFTNGTGTDYSISGSGFAGPGDLVKSGSGKVTLTNANSFTGPVALSAGTLELDHDAVGNVVLSGTSGVAVASGATLRLTRDDLGFTFNRVLSGAGTVVINPRTVGPNTTALAAVLSGASPAFSGTIRLESPLGGTYRLQQPAAAALGTAAIEVQDGAQLYAAGQTYNNPISITGIGYQDASAWIGSLRIEGATWAGPVVINGPSARIGAHGGTGTVSGSISGGDLEANVTNYNTSYTLVFTGANSYGTTTIGGQNTQTAGVPSLRLNIGNGGTSGTLGTGDVFVNGDGANGIIGFDRSNGYTLLPGQDIIGGGANVTRTFVDLDCLGAGFNDNGNPITLGGGTTLSGGFIRVGQSRANSVTNFTGTHTSGQLTVAVANGATLNLNPGATISTGYFTTGQAANSSGVVNQAPGTTVVVADQFRLGHFGTETSVYNMNGGTLTMTGDSPFLTPSTAAAGGNGTTGDNNINATNPQTIVGGGMYLGVDGTGIFNQNAGTVTTNWIVLDNRGNTGAGANMPDGIDRYNLNGGTLNVRSTWGILGRNTSTAMAFNGGTLRVDNTGTGTGTGASLAIPVDVDLTVGGAGSTLDTNGAGNSFILTKGIAGTGALAFGGGGTVTFSTAGVQRVTPVISSTGGTKIAKTGAGTTVLTGSGAGISGPVEVVAGRLELPAGSAPVSVTVGAGATLAGEFSTPFLNLNGGTLYINPNTPGGLNAGTVTLNNDNTIALTAIPAGLGPWTVFSYSGRVGAGTLNVAGAADFRNAPVVADTGSAVTLNIAPGKTLAWTGAVSGVWNVRNTANWADTAPPNGAELFFNADAVVFPDGAANPAVTIAGTPSPLAVLFNAATTNYTLTSSAGNQLSGAVGISKSGASTLTLAGPNLHDGPTAISGGTVSLAAATSLGSGAPGNGVSLSGGGRLNFTAAADLLATRDIEIGAGGGSIVLTNAAAQTVSLPGNLSGAGDLTLGSAGAGAPTFVLGSPVTAASGFSGNTNVNSAGGGLTTVRLASSAAINGGTVTFATPTTGAAGAATTLDLAGFNVPATATLVFNSQILGATSYRTQVTGSAGGGAINGPVQVNGDSIVQFSTSVNDSITINGPVTEGASGFGAATSVFFLRGGAGTGTVNGNINLPLGTVSKTDAGTWTINSTGNNWATSVVAVGTLRMGAANVLPSALTLIMGQNDTNTAVLNLNGFNQTVGSLQSNPATGTNANSKSITSATPATLTINQGISTSYAGQVTGAMSLVKNGFGSLTLANGASTYTGSVAVNEGLVDVTGQNGALGSNNTAGRVITVGSGAEVRFSINNVFGNGVGNANLPSLVVNGGTVSATRYNTIGAITLNGATLTQSASDSGGYEGYQFKGAVTAGGSGPSFITSTNGKANHLDAATVFTVADATGSFAADLVIDTVLRNQSADFGSGVGSLVKAGAGTLLLGGGAPHSYTGATTVNAGVLELGGSLAASPVTVNSGGTLSGTGSATAAAVVNAGGTIAPGSGAATLSFGGNLTLASGSSYAAEIYGAGASDKLAVTGVLNAAGTVRVSLVGYTPVLGDVFDLADASGITGATAFDFSGAALGAGLTWDTAQFATDGTIRVIAGTGDPFNAWASALGVTGGKGGDDDGDGVINLLEFATNSDPKSGGSVARAYGNVNTVGGQQALTITVATRKGATFAASGNRQNAVRDNVVYSVEAANDVTAWGEVGVTELNATDSAAVRATLTLPALGADWEWHSFRTEGATVGDISDIVRLKVSAQP